MHRRISTLVIAALIAAGACSRNNGRPADTALNTDLSLAAQQRAASLDSISAAEHANALAGTNTPAAPAAAAPTHTTSTASSGEVSHPRHHVSHSSGSSGASAVSTSSGGTVEKHTKRDAAIGAAAGAILGATTSHNKVKGGLIGAAVGGILGGVIGNNVDKKKKP